MTASTKPTRSGGAKKTIANVGAAIATVLVVGVIGEVMLRVKSSDQKSYSVEMWRYAKTLKQPDPLLGHVHIANAAARLQNVDISINSWGLRGPEPGPVDPTRRRVLVLGSSITLGWGVAEDKILTSLLQHRLGGGVEVLNGGIGNYTAERYVGLFKTHLRALKPDVIVVHYFLRDAEILPPASGGWLMRNSQLALMLWQAAANVMHGRDDLTGLEDYYKAMYAAGSEGRIRMEAALAELDTITRPAGITVVLAMMPDIHRLKPYPFGFVNEQMRDLAGRLGWAYVDLLDAFKDVPDAKALYAIPGDPHPNAAGHAMMADVLTPVLQKLGVGRAAK